MSWKLTPDKTSQPILALRLTHWSGVWDTVFRMWLQSRPLAILNS